LLVEQGQPDPHRDTCLDCRREHEARQEMVRAFSLVGTNEPGDPSWQRHVWRRISLEERSRAPWYRWLWAGGGLAAACVMVLVLLPVVRRGQPDKLRPHVETIPSEIKRRATSASVGDRLRVSVLPSQEVRIYRDENLVRRCSEKVVKPPGCVRDEAGLVAELELDRQGKYQILIVLEGGAEKLDGTFDRDVAALTAAGSTWQVQQLPVH
jgi:hypothetical protein